MAVQVLGRDVPLSMTKLAVAAGVGGATSLASYIDAKQGWTKSFRRTSDWLHVLIMGSAVLGLVKGRMPEHMETAVIADTPLLIKSAISTFAPEVGRRARGNDVVSEAERILLNKASRTRVGLVPGQTELPTELEMQRQRFI